MTRYANGTTRGRRLTGPEVPWDGSAVADVRKRDTKQTARDVGRGAIGAGFGAHTGMTAGGAVHGGLGIARAAREAGMSVKDAVRMTPTGAMLGAGNAAMNPRALRHPLVAAGALAGAVGGAGYMVNHGRTMDAGRRVQRARARQTRDVSDVGKAVGPALQATFADQGNQIAFAGGWQNKKRKKEIGQLQNQVKQLQAQQPAQSAGVGKAARHYDPESRRQRRLGAAIAGSALAGTAALGVGGRNIARSTRALRRTPTKIVDTTVNNHNASHTTHVMPHKGGTSYKPIVIDSSRSTRHSTEASRPVIAQRPKGELHLAARRRDAALVGGGTVALGGAGVLREKAERRRLGIWR